MSLKTMKQWSKWLSKAEVFQWDMLHALNVLTWAGNTKDSIWTRPSPWSTSTRKVRPQTYWRKDNSQCMARSNPFLCSIYTQKLLVSESVKHQETHCSDDQSFLASRKVLHMLDSAGGSSYSSQAPWKVLLQLGTRKLSRHHPLHKLIERCCYK